MSDTPRGSAACPRTGYVYLGERGRTIDRTLDLGEGVLLDVDANGKALGVECVGETDFDTAMWKIVGEASFATNPALVTEIRGRIVDAPPWEINGWIVAESVRCVCCPACGFTFDAMHKDTDRDGYTCSLCETRSDD